jgi:hypothetical protein
MAFLTAIYAFLADIIIFKVSFTNLQLIGLILALLIYLVQLIYFIREAKLEKVAKEKLEYEKF